MPVPSSLKSSCCQQLCRFWHRLLPKTQFKLVLSPQTISFSLVSPSPPAPFKFITTPRKMSSRSIIVDDTSPLISYQGQWSALSNNTIDGLFYPLENFNYTLNALQFGSGSFTFNFIGTNVSVYAAFRSFNSTQPSWTCLLDGNVLPPLVPLSNTSNNQICTSNTTTTKTTPINLTVVASDTADNPFLFDCIYYTPNPSTILDNATVVVQPLDSQIQYSSGWNLNTTDEQAETLVQGASMTFDFVGIQVSWLPGVTGSPNVNASTVNSSALYSIDSGTLIPFEVTVLSDHSSWIYAFQTPILSPGSHRLFVEYSGDNDNLNSSVPLALSALVVQNHTIPFHSNSAGLSDGTIAGVVIGSVAGLVLIIFIFIWFNKGPKKAAEPESVPLNVYEDGSDPRLPESSLPGADPETDPVRA